MNESKRRVADLSQPVNITPEELARFIEKVDKESSPHGCWLWTACTNEHGYGKLMFRSVNMKASRLSWAIYKGPIIGGLHVLHNCPGGDNPMCVNPDHLFLGTIQDNAADRCSKDRTAHGQTHKSVTCPESVLRGERHPLAKFTEVQVIEIKRRLSNGEKCSHIAKELGVWHGAISHIKQGKRWGHLQA